MADSVLICLDDSTALTSHCSAVAGFPSAATATVERQAIETTIGKSVLVIIACHFCCSIGTLRQLRTGKSGDRENSRNPQRSAWLGFSLHGAVPLVWTLSQFEVGLPVIATANKKADVTEHPRAFDHVGLLRNEPTGTAGLLFNQSSNDSVSVSRRSARRNPVCWTSANKASARWVKIRFRSVRAKGDATLDTYVPAPWCL